MKIIAGSSNPDLASAVAKLCNTELARVQLSEFPNGESRVVVTETSIGKEAVVLQSLSSPVDRHIVELALLSDAVTRMGVTELTVVVPWLGYAKQDKVFKPGEPLSVKVVAQLLQVAKYSRVITFDLHNQAIVGFFEIPVVELSARPLFLQHFRDSLDLPHTVVVAPDAGAVKSSTEFARELGVQTVYMDKKRDLVTGKVEVVGISGRVKNKHVLLVDDNIVTGSTLLTTSEVLRKEGAMSVRVGVTHHMWVPGVQEKIEKSGIDEIVVTDTVDSSEKLKVKSEKLKVLSVAGIIAEELSR